MAYIEPTQESAAAFVRRGIRGPVVMLNLLRFREQADYSRSPQLAPDAPITGVQAYLAGVGHRTAALEDSRLLPFSPDADDILGSAP